MALKYFGTDGIRGRTGTEPMTVEFVLKLGWAAGRVLGKKLGGRGKVVIGKDTRISGYMFESALESGFAAAGLDVMLLGPMPTPAIAYMTQAQRATAGVVISASHNPYHDDGVKFFNGDGFKLPVEMEEAIEAEMQQALQMVQPAEIGKASRLVDARGRYIEFCKNSIAFRTSLRGMKLVIDCANGATYDIAPSVFRELGATVYELGTEPDGLNINRDCGALHPEHMRAKLKQYHADAGIAFDGDGDRVIMMDGAGNVVDGDAILYMLAKSQIRSGRISGGVVGTLMTNMGLELALKQSHIPFARTSVGDKYVMEELRRRGWYLGGESSGHLICLNQTTTGDGIIAALQVLEWMSQRGMSLEEACSGMPKMPQVMINVPITGDAEGIINSVRVKQAVADVEAVLAERGRVLLRGSGTEPLLRVMVEGENDKQVRQLAEQISAEVRLLAET